ncbi:hypothetical protein WN48_06552 [Eufriesea mexicana]|uniref:Uncharacterized protein n=1 Tax=Eufriesea mexicana TaxID=516756 RepID=A0A310SLJ9_9HYME|nr:hypothetical protein WN48_06552 [Eufriesea mexicana]
MTLRCQRKGRQPSGGKPGRIALTINALRRGSFERGLEKWVVDGMGREGKEQRYPIIHLNSVGYFQTLLEYDGRSVPAEKALAFHTGLKGPVLEDTERALLSQSGRQGLPPKEEKTPSTQHSGVGGIPPSGQALRRPRLPETHLTARL